MGRSSDAQPVVLLWGLTLGATVIASVVWGHKTPLRLAAGVPVLAAGVLLAVVAWGFLGSGGGGLVTRGPYACSRHPFYIGLLLMLTGTVLSLGSVIGAAMLVLSAGASALRAAIEEKDLAQRFGEEYREYRARTPFLVGLPQHGGKGRTRR